MVRMATVRTDRAVSTTTTISMVRTDHITTIRTVRVVMSVTTMVRTDLVTAIARTVRTMADRTSSPVSTGSASRDRAGISVRGDTSVRVVTSALTDIRMAATARGLSP